MEYEIRTKSKNKKLVKQMQKKIKTAAVNVFLEKGFHKATMQEIAEEAGMVSGNIYNYIGSKDDILHLLCISSRDSIDKVKKNLRTLEGKNTEETLVKCIRTYFKITDRNYKNILFYNREIKNFSHSDRAILLNSIIEYRDFFENLIKNGTENGEFQAKSPLLLANNIVSFVHDWAIRKWALRRQLSAEEYLNLQIDVLFDSLKNTNGQKDS